MVESEFDKDLDTHWERFRREANEMSLTRSGQDTVIFTALKGAASKHGVADFAPDAALWQAAQKISRGEGPGS